MRLIHTLALLMLLCQIKAFAQQPMDELKKVSAYFDRNADLRFDVTYHLYLNHQASTPFSSEKARFIRSGKRFYYEIGNSVNICNDKYFFMVNKDEQVISVLQSTIDHKAPVMPIDSMVKGFSDISIKNMHQGLSNIVLTFPESDHMEYEKMIISYDPRDHSLKKISFFFATEHEFDEAAHLPAQKPRLEMVFDKIASAPDVNTWLSEKSYFLEKGQKLTLVGDYARYQLFDQRYKK